MNIFLKKLGIKATKSLVSANKWSFERSLLFILFFLTIFTLQAESLPHLILNFDVNKTLIASDKTENKSLKDVINELLSRKYSGYWEENLPRSMTFDEYVRIILLPGPDHDIELKNKRLTYLIHFIDYLHKDNHPLYDVVLEEFTLLLKTLENSQGNIFPSFYRLISELNQNKIPYTIFLRSFGKEVFEIKNEINAVCDNLFKRDGIFQRGTLCLDDQEILSEAQTIYDFFCSKQHAVIRDDWSYWVEGRMEAKYGKPLYIDQANKDILTLFFDDNIKLGSSVENIIAPLDPKTGELIFIPALIQSKQAISVNTLEAILNEHYYIELVKEALRFHQNLKDF